MQRAKGVMVGRCADGKGPCGEKKLRRLLNKRLENVSQQTFLILVVVVVSSTGCHVFRPFNQTNSTLADARLWEQGGRDALSNGRIEEAKNCLRRAINNAPDDRRIREQLADIYIDNGEYPEAIAELTRAVELSDGDADLRVKLGRAYLRSGKLIPAKRQAELALEGNRQLAAAWELCGQTHWSQSELPEAVADFQRALSIDPNRSGVQIQIAQLHRQMGQSKRALSGIEQLLSQYPTGQEPQDALLFQGVVLIELQQFESAMEKLQVAVNRNDATSDTFVQLSRAQFLAGQPSLARSTLTRGLERYPAEAKLTSLLNQLRESEDEHVAALDLIHR